MTESSTPTGSGTPGHDEATVSAAVAAALAAAAQASNLAELRRPASATRAIAAPRRRQPGHRGPAARERRRSAGGGTARAEVAAAFVARQEALEEDRDEQLLVAEVLDLTVRVPRRPLGARHPISLVSERVEDIFVAMGWEIAEGPEVEAEWLTFDALNLGPDHPARQMQDTFFVAPAQTSGLVLRTHTSPVQVRTMLTRRPPIYVLCPGKVFRTDDLDATHTPVFHQFEGLVVDKGITMAHLKGSLDAFVQRLFGEGIVTRLRPSYFPFTEPSAEIDCQCWICRGEDRACRVCRGTGWIEMGGSGMVNRRVLAAGGIDPDEYTGFAFGLGIERSLMLRHGVEDMHDIVEGDIRFSRQFGMEL